MSRHDHPITPASFSASSVMNATEHTVAEFTRGDRCQENVADLLRGTPR
jgi:hypothetical protein